MPGRGNANLGYSRNKATLRSTVRPVEGLQISPSVILCGKKFAYSTVDEDYTSVIGTLPATTMVNLFASYDGLVDGLTLGAGVFNMLDDEIFYAQPYNSYHAPLPAQDREFVARVTFNQPL